MSSCSPKQIKALTLMLTGNKTGRQIAEEVGVTPETISEWKASPGFAAEFNRLKKEAVESARDRIQALAVDAVAAIRDIILHSDSDATRLKAAKAVLDGAGLTDPQSGLYAWGIGPTSEEGVLSEWDRDRRHAAEMSALLGMHSGL